MAAAGGASSPDKDIDIDKIQIKAEADERDIIIDHEYGIMKINVKIRVTDESGTNLGIQTVTREHRISVAPEEMSAGTQAVVKGALEAILKKTEQIAKKEIRDYLMQKTISRFGAEEFEAGARAKLEKEDIKNALDTGRPMQITAVKVRDGMQLLLYHGGRLQKIHSPKAMGDEAAVQKSRSEAIEGATTAMEGAQKAINELKGLQSNTKIVELRDALMKYRKAIRDGGTPDKPALRKLLADTASVRQQMLEHRETIRKAIATINEASEFAQSTKGDLREINDARQKAIAWRRQLASGVSSEEDVASDQNFGEIARNLDAWEAMSKTPGVSAGAAGITISSGGGTASLTGPTIADLHATADATSGIGRTTGETIVDMPAVTSVDGGRGRAASAPGGRPLSPVVVSPAGPTSGPPSVFVSPSSLPSAPGPAERPVSVSGQQRDVTTPSDPRFAPLPPKSEPLSGTPSRPRAASSPGPTPTPTPSVSHGPPVSAPPRRYAAPELSAADLQQLEEWAEGKEPAGAHGTDDDQKLAKQLESELAEEEAREKKEAEALEAAIKEESAEHPEELKKLQEEEEKGEPSAGAAPGSLPPAPIAAPAAVTPASAPVRAPSVKLFAMVTKPYRRAFEGIVDRYLKQCSTPTQKMIFITALRKRTQLKPNAKLALEECLNAIEPRVREEMGGRIDRAGATTIGKTVGRAKTLLEMAAHNILLQKQKDLLDSLKASPKSDQ